MNDLQLRWHYFWKDWGFQTRPWLWRIGFLLALLLPLYLVGHGRYGLFDVDEAIFTQASREMLHSGKISMPSYNAEPRYQKPPLIYWAQAAGMEVLGEDSLWAARLPSALGALGALALLGWGTFRLTKSREWAFYTTAALGVNLSFLWIGRAAVADGLLNFASLALVMSVLIQLDKKPWRWQWVVTGLLAALALLAKGPVAGFPAATVVGTLLLFREDRLDLWKRLKPFPTALVMFLALVPWLALMSVQGGWDFFYKFIMVENLHRYGGGLTNTQSKSHLFYLVVLLMGFLPWVFFLPRAIWALKDGFVARLKNPTMKEALPALALVWAVAYVVFFSFSKTKLAHYIVPAYPGFALVVGWWLARRVKAKSFWLDGLWVVPVIGTLALVFALVPTILDGLRVVALSGFVGMVQDWVGFAWPPKDLIAFEVLKTPVDLGGVTYVMAFLLVGCVLPAWAMLGRSIKGAFEALAMSMACFLFALGWGLLPAVWHYTQEPLAVLAADIREAPPALPLVHLGMHKPSVLYLTQRPFVKLENAVQLRDFLASPVLVLTELPYVPKIRRELFLYPHVAMDEQDCRGGYCLLLIHPID